MNRPREVLTAAARRADDQHPSVHRAGQLDLLTHPRDGRYVANDLAQRKPLERLTQHGSQTLVKLRRRPLGHLHPPAVWRLFVPGPPPGPPASPWHRRPAAGSRPSGFAIARRRPVSPRRSSCAVPGTPRAAGTDHVPDRDCRHCGSRLGSRNAGPAANPRPAPSRLHKPHWQR